MKKIFDIIAVVAAVFIACSCAEDHSYADDTPMKISNYQIRGIWELVSIDGEDMPDDELLYQYLELKTEEDVQVFGFYQNINSQLPRLVTGTYSLSYDEYDGNIISGDYAHASGPWANDYVVTALTGDSMTWTVLGDSDSFYVYSRVAEIPADKIPSEPEVETP